jgi:hypothetical protein
MDVGDLKPRAARSFIPAIKVRELLKFRTGLAVQFLTGYGCHLCAFGPAVLVSACGGASLFSAN